MVYNRLEADYWLCWAGCAGKSITEWVIWQSSETGWYDIVWETELQYTGTSQLYTVKVEVDEWKCRERLEKHWTCYSTQHLTHISVDYQRIQFIQLTMMCVFGRLMSQLADVNTQSTVGMWHFYDVLHCSFCASCTRLFYTLWLIKRMTLKLKGKEGYSSLQAGLRSPLWELAWHTILDHTVLPATRQRWHSRLSPTEAGTRFP